MSVHTNNGFEDTDKNGYSYANDRNNDEIRHTYLQPLPQPQPQPQPPPQPHQQPQEQRMYSYNACYNARLNEY